MKITKRLMAISVAFAMVAFVGSPTLGQVFSGHFSPVDVTTGKIGECEEDFKGDAALFGEAVDEDVLAAGMDKGSETRAGLKHF